MSFFDWTKQMFSSAPATAAPSADLSPPPKVIVDFNDERVPKTSQDRIRRIVACLHEVELAITREETPGFNRFELEQMRDLHLPKLVKSYIDIPPEHRAEIFRETGKSASFILNESLDKMQAKIDDILRNLAQNDIEAFTNNTRFIGQRYASDDNPFA